MVDTPLFFQRIGKYIFDHREADTAQDNEDSNDKLQDIGIAAVETEKIVLEQGKTSVVERRDGMEYGIIRFLVYIQKGRIVAPVEKYQDRSDRFDDQGGVEYFFEQEDTFLKVPGFQRIFNQCLVAYAYVPFGQDEEKSRESDNVQSAELDQQHDDDLSPQGKRTAYVDRSQSGDTTGRCGGEKRIDIRQVYSVRTHLGQHQQGRSREDQEQERQDEQFLGGKLCGRQERGCPAYFYDQQDQKSYLFDDRRKEFRVLYAYERENISEKSRGKRFINDDK